MQLLNRRVEAEPRLTGAFQANYRLKIENVLKNQWAFAALIPFAGGNNIGFSLSLGFKCMIRCPK